MFRTYSWQESQDWKLVGWLTVLLNFSYNLLPNLWDSEHHLAAWLMVKGGARLCQDSPWRTMTGHSPSFWLGHVCCALPVPAWPGEARTLVAWSLCISFFLSRNRILLTVLQSLLHIRAGKSCGHGFKCNEDIKLCRFHKGLHTVWGWEKEWNFAHRNEEKI